MTIAVPTTELPAGYICFLKPQKTSIITKEEKMKLLIVLYAVAVISHFVSIVFYGVLSGTTLRHLLLVIPGLLVGGGTVVVLVKLLVSPPATWMMPFLTGILLVSIALWLAGFVLVPRG